MAKEDDRTLAEFRGFALVARVMIDEIQDDEILDKVEAVVLEIQNALRKQKVVILSK